MIRICLITAAMLGGILSAAAAAPEPDAVTTPDEQVEAIRARIEARRARMREQE